RESEIHTTRQAPSVRGIRRIIECHPIRREIAKLDELLVLVFLSAGHRMEHQLVDDDRADQRRWVIGAGAGAELGQSSWAVVTERTPAGCRQLFADAGDDAAERDAV